MKEIIIVQNKRELKAVVESEIFQHGLNCDLNHIDVSKITDMANLFELSEFNGDISQWNVSNVINMNFMFKDSQFNGDISNWNLSKALTTAYMFHRSKFNTDISNWDMSNVSNMQGMFCLAEFNGNITEWNVSNLKSMTEMFYHFKTDVPYWGLIEDNDERKKAIYSYHLNKQLNQDLSGNNNTQKRIKI